MSIHVTNDLPVVSWQCLLNFSLPKMYVFHSLIQFCNLSLYLLFQEENIQRCSMSADSQVENSGSEDSTDDDNIDVKENGYHDAENEVDQETDDDADRIQSGKLSESSGYAGSDLYDYKVISCSVISSVIEIYID